MWNHALWSPRLARETAWKVPGESVNKVVFSRSQNVMHVSLMLSGVTARWTGLQVLRYPHKAGWGSVR